LISFQHKRGIKLISELCICHYTKTHATFNDNHSNNHEGTFCSL